MKRNNVPGPGSYEQGVGTIKQTGPYYKFGSSSRDETSLLTGSKTTPGPGSYAQPTLIGKGSQKTFMPHEARSESLERIKDLPGPGAYDPFDSPIKTQAPQTKFGSSRRDQHSQSHNQLPGPGAYNHSVTLVKAGASHWTMGKASRDHAVSESKLPPGPGQY